MKVGAGGSVGAFHVSSLFNSTSLMLTYLDCFLFPSTFRHILFQQSRLHHSSILFESYSDAASSWLVTVDILLFTAGCKQRPKRVAKPR